MDHRSPNSALRSQRTPPWTERTGRYHLTHAARGATPAERRRERTLAAWYGPELAPAEIGAHRVEPRTLGELLDVALRNLGSAEVLVLERVRGLWPSLAGADIARRAQPVALSERVLMIEVANATWRYVLEREHRQRLCQRLRDATAGEVTEIRFMPPGRATRPGAA